MIQVDKSGTAIGIDHDYQRVQPKNGDGFVNWLTTHLIHALGHTPVTWTRARITAYMGKEICRVDIARHTEPVWAKKQSGTFSATGTTDWRPARADANFPFAALT